MYLERERSNMCVMDTGRHNLARTLLTSLVILIGCSTALALVCSSRILAYYFARQMNRRRAGCALDVRTHL